MWYQRTDVQNSREGNAVASVVLILAEFAQRKGDPYPGHYSPLSRDGKQISVYVPRR